MDTTAQDFKPTISIIIFSFNYEDYVRDAIESALSQDYQNKEIIVVDDGSTDNSRSVIDKFSDKIIKIFKTNGGQIDSANEGFRVSKGSIIMFLDSDDYLLSGCLTTISKNWKSEFSKLHFILEKRSRDGTFLGYHPDDCKLDSGYCREIYLKKSWYRTTVTSGNVFSRKFLDSFFPLPCIEKEGLDGYLNTYAALNGNIGKIEKPLAVYRQHSKSNRARHHLDTKHICGYVNHELQRYYLAKKLVPEYVTPNFLIKYPERCFHFIAVKCLNLQKLPSEIDWPISFLAARCFFSEIINGDGTLRYRLGTALWFLLLIIPSQFLQKTVITWKYSFAHRPALLTSFFKIFNFFFFKNNQSGNFL